MQPTQDGLSVARRPLDVEDYIDIVRRHKHWIIGPAFAGLVVSVLVAFVWPDSYISQATIQVVPPQVPERFVSSNVNSEMNQRINAMAQEITGRESLTNLITTHNLYRRDVERMPMSDVVEKMRRSIQISPVGSLQINSQSSISAFRVSFKYSDRFKAQKVNQDLTRRFIDQSITDLQQQSVATTNFLKDQWENAKRNLEDTERRMTEFRVRNAGKLPDQMNANLQSLQALQSQLVAVNEAISRASQEKLLLESQLRIYREQLRTAGETTESGVSVQVKNERLAQIEREIVNTETGIAALRERYKDSHPDVKTAQAQLGILRSRRESLLKEEEAKTPEAPAPRASAAQRRNTQQLEAVVSGTESQIQAKNLEIEERTKTQARLNEAISNLNARIQATPSAEGEYAEITRDLTQARQRYDELNTKKSMSEIATNLERRGQGARLDPLETASLPERPAEPDRVLIVIAGLAIGLLSGVFVTGAREMKDTSLKSLKDARAYTGLPVLGTVPLLENDFVVKRKRRLVWLAWAVACVVGVLVMTGSVYYYYYVARV